MTRLVYFTFAAVLAIGAIAATARAQDKTKTLTTIGPVKEVANGFFTVDAKNTTMKFMIDTNTSVQAQGAGTKTRAKKAAGEGGLTISDVVHTGDQVRVRYVEAGGGFLASSVEVMKRRPDNVQPVKPAK